MPIIVFLVFLIFCVCLYLINPDFGVMVANSVKGQRGSPDRFLFYLFSMLGKLANVDGHVSRSEVAYVERLEVELPDDQRILLSRYFNEAKSSIRNFDTYVDDFVSEFPNETELHLDLLDCLVGLAFADGVLLDSELQALQVAADTFRVPSGSFNILFERHARRNAKRAEKANSNFGSTPPKPETSEQWPYTVLGVKSNDSIATIKARYRKLVFEYHPDSASLRGVAPEVRKLSEHRFRELKEAYETIRVKKSF